MSKLYSNYTIKNMANTIILNFKCGGGKIPVVTYPKICSINIDNLNISNTWDGVTVIKGDTSITITVPAYSNYDEGRTILSKLTFDINGIDGCESREYNLLLCQEMCDGGIIFLEKPNGSQFTIPCTGETECSINRALITNVYSITEIAKVKIRNEATRFSEDSVFSGATVLKVVSMDKSCKVDSIPDYTFRGCTSLSSVTISKSVTSIGEKAFYGCSDTMTVNMNSYTPPSIGNEAFGGTRTGLKIKVPSGASVIYKNAWSAYENNIEEQE